MEKMNWNQDTMSYRGTCRNGEIVDVTGDEWSESVADGINALADNRGIAREDLTDEQRDEFEDLTLAELDDPDLWASLAGDNPNVEMIEA